MADLLKLWQQAQDSLKQTLGTTTFETWIQPLKPNIKGQGQLSLEAPDVFFRDWVDRHYKNFIQDHELDD